MIPKILEVLMTLSEGLSHRPLFEMHNPVVLNPVWCLKCHTLWRWTDEAEEVVRDGCGWSSWDLSLILCCGASMPMCSGFVRLGSCFTPTLPASVQGTATK
eukprot:scaffold61920_cov23-Cyclotella_meneghiniana.AAC.2